MSDEQVLACFEADDLRRFSLHADSSSSEEFMTFDDVPGFEQMDLTTSLLNTPTRLRSLTSLEDSHPCTHSELELFQHFMSHTSRTMPLTNSPDMHRLWTVQVPQMALRSSFLLESVAMIAAFGCPVASFLWLSPQEHAR
jgi:hypothetical protein